MILLLLYYWGFDLRVCCCSWWILSTSEATSFFFLFLFCLYIHVLFNIVFFFCVCEIIILCLHVPVTIQSFYSDSAHFLSCFRTLSQTQKVKIHISELNLTYCRILGFTSLWSFDKENFCGSFSCFTASPLTATKNKAKGAHSFIFWQFLERANKKEQHWQTEV